MAVKIALVGDFESGLLSSVRVVDIGAAVAYVGASPQQVMENIISNFARRRARNWRGC